MTMPPPTDVDLLGVHLGDRRVGTLLRLPDDRITFSFDPSYADDVDRPTLSLGFKRQGGGLLTPKVSKTKLPAYFANLLPEGPLREYLAERSGVKQVRDFPLIALLGQDLPGNVRVTVEGDGPPVELTDARHRSSEQPFKFSLAGVQLKFSALESADGGLTIPVSGAGGDWILKLPSARFSGVPVQEFLMLELARAVGITVPPTRLVAVDQVVGLPQDIQLQESQALAVRRFDREPGRRIHMEDFAQVFGVYPDEKYAKASNESIGKVINAEIGLDGVLDMVRRLVFTVLIGNGDMHLKNWSLLYPDGRTPRVAPAYDYVSTVAYLPGDTLGLSIGGTKSMSAVDVDHFVRFAARVGAPARAVTDTVSTTVEAFKHAWRDRDGYGDLPTGHAERLVAHMESLALWRRG